MNQIADAAVLELLRSGYAPLKIELSDEQEQSLLAYIKLFVKWNRAYNLSAIRDWQGIVQLHILDSLTIVPYITGKHIIDVGTGGGLPGIVLAILFPARHFTLLDSAGKKMRFLRQVVQELSLKNVEIENCRVEAFTPVKLFDGVVSRAFASLQKICRF